MGKRFNYLKGFLILFILTNFVSCYYFDTSMEVDDKSDFAYSRLSFSQREFESNNGWMSYLYYYDDEGTEFYFSHADMRADAVLFVDARRADGYSTWSSPQFAFKYDPGSSKAEFDKIHTHYYKSHITMSSPPAHLHLCLNKLDEEYYTSLNKKWKVTSVTDESGKSLADDPDWGNYTDNIMSFKKADKFVFTPGAKRSKIELDLFGNEIEHSVLYGSYSVKEDASKKVTLTLAFPSFQQQLEVVSSSWTGLTLKGTIAGKTGIALLVPFN